MTDPIVPHSVSISTYMSAHPATNLAYVRYFAQLDTATSATFKSVDAKGIRLTFVLADGSDGETYIQFKNPLTSRDQVRPVLEEMAKEAEAALGWPSTLTGPPPFAAIAKAFYSGEVNEQPREKPPVKLDTFYPVPSDTRRFLTVGALLLVILGHTQFIKTSARTKSVAQKVIRTVVSLHVIEGTLAFLICLKRGWYSPLNTLKWTASSYLYGVGSLMLLRKHGRQIQKQRERRQREQQEQQGH